VKTVSVRLPYGEGSVKASIPERFLTSIVTPSEMPAVQDSRREIDGSLQDPINSPGLEAMAEGCRSPCIIISDSTRPTPSGLIVESVLGVLNNVGIRDEKIKVVVATGLHRSPTRDELVERLGEYLLKRLDVLSHDAYDTRNLIDMGFTSKGTPIWVNKAVQECDLVIGDGYIEPHFFAGYTGGGKNILPGVAGFETVKVNHGATMIEHPNARAGVLEGNPIYEDIVEGASLGGLNFSINVTLNSRKRVSGVFAGEFEEAHCEGCRFLEGHVRVESAEADIVITTNGGYPLDRDLYQAVKGMTTGEVVVREGGTIIVASECRDGVGHPKFRELVERGRTPEEILGIIRSPGFFQLDQWEAQVLARVLTRCEVICVTGGVEPGIIENMHMTHAKSMDEALSLALDRIGRDPEITAIPGGPSTIPHVP
jgi:nickel-dependent lactate racemase